MPDQARCDFDPAVKAYYDQAQEETVTFRSWRRFGGRDGEVLALHDSTPAHHPHIATPMTRSAIRIIVAVLLALPALAACGPRGENADSSAGAPDSAAARSLYDRLGGTTAIAGVVDGFVANVAADARINKFFTRVAGDTAAMRDFKQKLVDQICQGTGGPCTYTGKDMRTAHQGMGLSNADFDALVEDLVKALDSAGVPQKDKDELLGILGPMRADIVTK